MVKPNFLVDKPNVKHKPIIFTKKYYGSMLESSLIVPFPLSFSSLAVSHGITSSEEDIMNTLDDSTSNYYPNNDDIHYTDESYSDNYYATQEKVNSIKIPFV